jgi:hypothetical protein
MPLSPITLKYPDRAIYFASAGRYPDSARGSSDTLHSALFVKGGLHGVRSCRNSSSNLLGDISISLCDFTGSPHKGGMLHGE